MSTPPEIIDALESVLEIYFSGVRHRERAAFILCDNLVEMTCKTKAKQYNHRFDMSCNFHNACTSPDVDLPPDLKVRVVGYRNTRNNMQHASAAATVDLHHCATSMLDVVKVIDHCWTDTSTTRFPSRMKCALRIARLYSSEGDISLREVFETRMQKKTLANSERKRPRHRTANPARA
ncbi:MAG: hypothetical protein HC780_29775 [Leptolyngbyaceae cyanobacterium CSU_1_3]|nr:hypothetical protein [Leptolyngbyaceae cyanobacterium CSU_1_3]